MACDAELFGVLRKIINEISALDDADSIKLSMYTRCLFQVTVPFKQELGDMLLDEAHAMVNEAHRVSQNLDTTMYGLAGS